MEKLSLNRSSTDPGTVIFLQHYSFPSPLYSRSGRLTNNYCPVPRFPSLKVSFRLGTQNQLNRNKPFPSSPGPLYQKTRLSAQPLIWKWFFILMQMKLICTRKVVHLASFWRWGFLELGSGLFHESLSWNAGVPSHHPPRLGETTGHELALRCVHTMAVSFSYQHEKLSGIVWTPIR